MGGGLEAEYCIGMSKLYKPKRVQYRTWLRQQAER